MTLDGEDEGVPPPVARPARAASEAEALENQDTHDSMLSGVWAPSRKYTRLPPGSLLLLVSPCACWQLLLLQN